MSGFTTVIPPTAPVRLRGSPTARSPPNVERFSPRRPPKRAAFQSGVSWAPTGVVSASASASANTVDGDAWINDAERTDQLRDEV